MLFNFAELVQHGYDTGGDFDEAMRVYSEFTELNGYRLILPDEAALAAVKEKFDVEFGNKPKLPTVQLGISGYEWICPKCHSYYRVSDVPLIVICGNCRTEFETVLPD